MSNKINTAIEMYKQVNENIKNLEKEARKLRVQKNRLETYILNTIEANNLQEKDIKVDTNTKIKYTTVTRKEPMSQKYVKSALEDYYISNFGHRMNTTRCHEKADEIYSFLINNRKDKTSAQLKIIHT
tara:strand:- start:5798 stop:6181 length:384 start_codon:yes stop_codon:yes gene_type:complete